MRQRACTELLRQAAQAAGLLAASDAPCADGVISEAASGAIEALLENRRSRCPSRRTKPAAATMRRTQARYRTGERVRARHILFAVTPGVDVAALRKRAEPIFLDVRCHDGQAVRPLCRGGAQVVQLPERRARAATWAGSQRDDCAPEFARELFGHAEVGVLPRLVHSRFGLHVVEVLEREPGVAQPFESVRGAVAMSLRQQAFVTALRQYLRLLAGQAAVEGVELDAADTPLVQ